MGILYKYPFVNGRVILEKIKSYDYQSVDELLIKNPMKTDNVFVFADDASVLVFKTKIKLIAKKFYVVAALSPKLFVFNNEIVLQPLFPTETIRLGAKTEL